LRRNGRGQEWLAAHPPSPSAPSQGEAAAAGGLFARRFCAGWVHCQIVWRVVPTIEAAPLRLHELAVAWLRLLLGGSSSYGHSPQRRARWWERLTINLHHNLGRHR
jgi:hypothetical protein